MCPKRILRDHKGNTFNATTTSQQQSLQRSKHPVSDLEIGGSFPKGDEKRIPSNWDFRACIFLGVSLVQIREKLLVMFCQSFRYISCILTPTHTCMAASADSVLEKEDGVFSQFPVGSLIIVLSIKYDRLAHPTAH